MSRGKKLQEMEVDVKESNAVTAGANSGDKALPKAGSNAAGVSTPGNSGSWEDLGGPTPENYKTDDESAKLKTPGASLKQVRDVVNKGAKPGDQTAGTLKKEESETEGEVVAEEEVSTEEVVAESEVTEEEVVEEVDEAPSQLRKKMKAAIGEASETEEEVVAEESADDGLNIDADVSALLGGEELSEEFQKKAKTIFEAAISSKIASIKEQLEEDHIKAIQEETEALKGELTERVDGYLEYVADEWLQENQIAVDTGLKAELSESFMTGLKGLFEEHYVTIPEDKYDVLESMVNKLDDMELKLNEQIDKNVALNKRLAESTSDGIFGEVTEGLAVTQKDKLESLAESVEFESEADYREKLVTLREAYFPTRPASAQRDTSENISEQTVPATKDVSGSMANYLTALQRVAKK